MAGEVSETFSPTQSRGSFSAAVARNDLLCREHYKLVIELPEFPPTSPGQFIQLACHNLDIDDTPTGEIEWDQAVMPRLNGQDLVYPQAMLRRPFSLAGRADEEGRVSLEVIHRVVGVGTDWLSRLNVGDSVQIIGPLGNRFILPSPGQQAILVGGGVGIPPMLYLATKLAGRPAIAFCGATSRDLFPLGLRQDQLDADRALILLMRVEEFARFEIPTILTTDDGTAGYAGFVTQALEAHLDSAKHTLKPLIYTCGPEPMMKRVADIALRRGIGCQIAVERAMACGMGTCQSCVIKVAAHDRPDGRAWVYRLACTDGPIFKSTDLLW